MPDPLDAMALSKALATGSRRPVAFTPKTHVTVHSFSESTALPLLVEGTPGSSLLYWIESYRGDLESYLGNHGAVLFRGFGTASPADFERVVSQIGPDLMEYRERSSPRTQVVDRVYTSTDHPPDQSIFLHNEHSYAKTFPLRLFFFCQNAGDSGGETTLADTRRILTSIDPEVRDRFAAKGYCYVRNFGDGFGLSWQTAFQTDHRREVEEYCRQADIEWEWKEGDRLRTRQQRPVVIVHPLTSEPVWFNHLAFFHISTLHGDVRGALQGRFRKGDLPNNTYYGDGSEIEPYVLDHIRAAYRSNTVRLAWRPGDILALDNMLVSHGRSSYSGPRRVLFAMAQPHTRKDL